MPPKTKMTPEQVAQDVEEKELNVREFKDPHAVKHPGVNKDITYTKKVIAVPITERDKFHDTRKDDFEREQMERADNDENA